MSVLYSLLLLLLLSVVCPLLAQKVEADVTERIPAQIVPAGFKTFNTSYTGVSPVPKLGSRQFYIHGAGFGGAGQFLGSPVWLQLLKYITPNDYKAVESYIKKMSNPTKTLQNIQLKLENSPIVAAWAIAKTLQNSGQGGMLSQPTTATRLLAMEWDVFIDPNYPADLSKAKIAHGTQLTLVIQNMLKNVPTSTYMRDVKEAPSALQWMRSFGRAIFIYRQAVSKGVESIQDLQDLKDSKRAISIAASFLGQNGGLVLDVKSTYSTGAQITLFANALRTQYNINVLGIGSFVFSQFNGLASWLRPVKFFHTVYGLIHHYNAGELKRGDTIMFNAGSLLTQNGNTFALNNDLVSKLQSIKAEINYNLAFYVQEPAIQPSAVAALINFTNQQTSLVNLGFAWGNIDGVSENKLAGNGLGAQGTMQTVEKLVVQKDNAVSATKNAVTSVKNKISNGWNALKNAVTKKK